MVVVLRDAQRARRAQVESAAPYVSLVRAASKLSAMPKQLPDRMRVATYNVHRWSGVSGRQAPDATRPGIVISELDADVVANRFGLLSRAGQYVVDRLETTVTVPHGVLLSDSAHCSEGLVFASWLCRPLGPHLG